MTPIATAMKWQTICKVIAFPTKSSIPLAFILLGISIVFLFFSVVCFEAQHLSDRQAPGVGRHEEGKAPMAQSWNKHIFPKLTPADGFTIIQDRGLVHDVLVLGHCNQQTLLTWLLDVFCDQATPPCKFHVIWYLFKCAVIVDLPPLL